MALFKVYYGELTELQEDDFTTLPFHDGYGYFITDNQYFYVDYLDGETQRRRRIRTDLAKFLVDENNPNGYISVADIVLTTDIMDVEHGGTGLTAIAENAVLIGTGVDPDDDDPSTSMKAISGVGVFMHPEGEEPKFDTVPIIMGGTGATSFEEARDADHLNVYTRNEVDTSVDKAISKAYNYTLVSSSWVGNETDGYTQNYTNPAIRCGVNGNIPPIVTYVTNLDDWIKVDSAEATPGTGIVFKAKKKPEDDIDIIIVDNA